LGILRGLLSPGPSRFAKARAALLLGLIPGLAGILCTHWRLTAGLERNGLDLLFLMRGPRPAPAGVCVVALDEASYKVLSVAPTSAWPRALHGELVRTLSREGARAIAFDVLFLDAGDPGQDSVLETALRESGRVVLGSTVDHVDDPRFREARLLEPHGPFAEAAAAVADVNVATDRDGVIRSASLVHQDRPTLALAAYEVATGDRTLREDRPRLIDYHGPARTIPTVSVYQALDPAQHLPPGFFRDKIVFVGLSFASATGPAAKDAFLTPFRGAHGNLTYGVEIHATLAANLLERRRIDLLPGWAEAAFLLALPLLASLVFLRLRPVLGGAAFLLLEIVPWAAGNLAFTRAHVWVPLVIPSAVELPLAYVLSLIWYYLTTVRDRERIKKAFSFYLSPEMIRKIAASPESLNLGGEEIVATAMFTDIRGFTSIAEPLPAPQVAALLNDYFSQMTAHVFELQGTLIKYIGDAVFAIWGAPIVQEDHASRACRAALALARAQHAGPHELVTRIGVHTGAMLVGNLGSSQRFDYTAIGDAVNLAARLEGLNKAFGTRALLSGDTLARTGGEFVTRSLGRARVVGRSEPVQIHELVGLRGESTAPDARALARFDVALADFAARRFREAREGFHDVRTGCGGADGPSEFFLRQIEGFERESPPPSWDAVISFESK